MHIPQLLKKMRKERGRNQEQTAEMFGVSRVTYNLIENEKTPWEPYRVQIEDSFDISIDAIDRKPQTTVDRVLTDEQYDAVKDLFLYVVNSTSNLPNVGKTVLYKILYFCEFDRYETTQERLFAIDFVKLPRGPAPASFDYIANRLEKEKDILIVSANYNGYTQQRYIINKKVSPDSVDATKRAFVDSVIDNIGQMNAKEVSDYSHGDMPRKATKDMEAIDITLAMHREYPYSVRAVAEMKEYAQEQASMMGVFDDLADEQDLYEDYR